jgi:Competence protein CoiA-like family
LPDDLLVVGLDLETGCEVHVSEPSPSYWYARGYSGRRTLVCTLCYAGIDAEPGTRVPLVVRGRIGGLRRPHFAHPPGQAPAGGHHPESAWHLSGKAVLAAWARGQPGVVDVAVERCTNDLARRCDVHVRFCDGREVALEVQAAPLTDGEWSARHADYQRQGITDVWLWRPGTRPHWVAAAGGHSLWELDPGKERAYLLLGAAHDRPACWWAAEDLHLYAPHEPPCVGDTLRRRELPLSTIGLTADGLVIPDCVQQEINNARTGVRGAAERARAARAGHTRPQPLEPPASRPASQPTRHVAAGLRPSPTAKPGKLACKTCGLPLDPILARIGHHIGC